MPAEVSVGRAVVHVISILAMAMASLGTAHASPGKVKKAAKLQTAYELGDRAALVEALGVLEAAIEHPKVNDDPSAWARLGHLRFEAAKAASDAEGLSDAARDLAKALELGADGPVRSSVVGDLKTIMGTLYSTTFDALESKRFDEAASLLASVLAVRQSLSDIGEKVNALEDRLLSLAIRVSIQQQNLDDALGYQAALTKRGFFDAGISTYLARELAAAGRGPEALSLLADLATDYPADPRVLLTDVDLRVEAGDVDGALARIDGQKESLWRSVSGTLLLAQLYASAGLDAEVLLAYRRVLEQDENHLDATLAIAQSRFAGAASDQATLDAGGQSFTEKKALKTSIAQSLTEALQLFERALKLSSGRADVAEALAKTHEALGDEEAARVVRDAIETPTVGAP